MPTIRQKFFYAVRFGDVEALWQSLDLGADVRWRLLYEHTRTGLHCAAKEGHLACVKILVNSKADVNAIDSQRYTPIHLAAINGHAECIRLLGATAKADIRDGYWNTPLHWAAWEGHSESVIALLDLDADIDAYCGYHNGQSWNLQVDFMARPYLGTALVFAAQKAKLGCIKVLCERKADVNQVGRWGWTPLAEAAYLGNVDICRMLIYYFAKVDLTNSHGDTPLHHAASQGNLELCKLLLERERPRIISILDKVSPLPTYIHAQIAEYLYEDMDRKLLGLLNNNCQMAYHVARKGKAKEYLYEILSEERDFLSLEKVSFRRYPFFITGALG